jgi:hypothetical protein
LAATLVPTIASAQNLVMPDNCNLFGPTVSTSTWRSTAGRFQLAYDSSNFTNAGVTGPVLITRLRFRARDGQPDLGGNVFGTVTVEVGQCAVDHAVMSTTFASNRGPMGAPGSTSVAVGPSLGGVPNDYPIDIDLVAIGASYLYDPTTGNDVLFDITFNAPTPSTNLVTLAAGSGTVSSARGRMCTTSSPASATGGLLAPPVVQVSFSGTGGYTTEPAAHIERIGHCCGATFQSFYQDFQTSEAFDLANTSITMTPNSVTAPTGYAVTAGTTPVDFTKLNPTPNSTADSALVSHPLGFSFPYMSGTTTAIGATTKGYVWLDPAMTLVDATPAVAELIGSAAAQTARVAPLWFNFNCGRNTTTHPNAGLHVMTDTSGGPGNAVCYVTWYKVGLTITTAVGGTSVNDIQCVFREATGEIEMRFGAMQFGPGSLGITGFSPGRIGTVASFHPGPRDLSAELPLVTGPDSGAHGLSHGTSTMMRPVAGTSITFQSYNQPASAVLGLMVLDTAATTPSVHVPGLFEPGCGFSLSSTFLISEVVLSPTGTWTSQPLLIQPAWMGQQLFSQWFTADANFVLSSSNALRLTVGLN